MTSKNFISLIALIIVIEIMLITITTGISNSISVNVTNTRNLKLDFIAVDGPTSFDQSISDSILFINKTYPLADTALTYSEISPFNTSSLSDLGSLFKLQLLFSIRFKSLVSGQLTDRTIGIVPSNWFDNVLGESSTTGFAILAPNDLMRGISPNSVIIAQGYRAQAAHELGHTYGLCDEYSSVEWERADSLFGITSNLCPNGDADNNNQLDVSCSANGGCKDSTIGKLIPWNNSDGEVEIINFMGSSSIQEKRWITKESYNHLLDEFSHSTPITVPSRLLVGGFYNKITQTIDFENFYELGSGFAQNESEFKNGNFSILTSNQSNNPISNFTFDLSFVLASGDGNVTELNVTPFILVMPFSGNVSKISFIKNQTVGKEVNRTANTPQLNITSNLSGKTFAKELFNVTWNATDVDNDTLAYAILFSADNGGNYTTLEIDYNNTKITLNSSNLLLCSSCRIKILVTDGINTNFSLTEVFAINNTKTINLTKENITEDGYIDKVYNNYVRHKTESTILIGGIYLSRGYIEFNTSSILDNANIEDVDLNLTLPYLGSVNCDINDLEFRPSQVSDQTVYNDSAYGNYIYNNNFCVLQQAPRLDLGNNADSDLQSQLNNDWFGVGIKQTTETSTSSAYIYSSESSYDPVLIVTYTV